MNLLFSLLLLSGANCFAIPQGSRFPPWHPLDRTKELDRSSRLDPCHDFSEVICTTREPVVPVLDEELLRALRVLSKYKPDDVTKELADSVKGFRLSDKCEPVPNIPNGKERAAFLGMLVAHGLSESISVKINATLKTAELRLKSLYSSPSSGPPRNYGFETTTVLAKNLPEHLMDFLLAYFETVDFEKRFDVEEFDVTFEKDVEKSPDFTESSRVFKSSFGIEHIRPKRAAREADPPLLVLADSDVMSSYSNLLISSGLLKIDPKLVHDPDFVKDLKIMTQNILDEIGFHFDEMDWISPESKEKLKNVHTIDDYLFGPSEKFLNQTMVDKALKFYQDYFRKMRPFADENMEKLDFPPNCKPVYYETVFKVADTAFQLYNDYDFGHYGERTVISYQFYENNAGNSAENKKMIFGLPHISGYRQKLPLPFVYGAIGGTIGHETFHSYGVRKILIDGVDDVFNSYTYRSAVSCLEDYYSSFIGPNWTRPDGAMKANEGFADLQSARMIARLIKRGIYKEAHKDSSRWFSDTKDFDHFDEIIGRDDDDRDLKLAFSAMADVYCREYFQEQNNTKLETKNMMEDVHPRYAIRLNAIHRQLPEFTETFKCSHDSRMYRVEELCDAFPFYEKVKNGAAWRDYENEMK